MNHDCPWCDDTHKSSEALAAHVRDQHVGPATADHLRQLRARRQGRTS